MSLAMDLKDVIDDTKRLHLVVTTTGHYLSSEMDVNHEGDLVGELPEFHSAFSF